MTFVAKELYDALSADVDGMRKELADVRVLAEEVQKTKREVLPLAKQTQELRRLVDTFRELDAVVIFRRVEALTLQSNALLEKVNAMDATFVTRDQLAHVRSAFDLSLAELAKKRAPPQTFEEVLEAMGDAELGQLVRTELAAVLDEFEGGPGPSENRLKAIYYELGRRA